MRVAVRSVVVFLALLAGAVAAVAAAPEPNSAAALRARFAGLGEQLSHNQFQRALYLESSEPPNGSKGDIYALVEYPFATVGAALNSPAQWCAVLILHLNTKYCGASTDNARSTLVLKVGRKYNQPLKDAFGFEFAFRVASGSPDYLQVRLNADNGPLGTSNYRIMLEAIPVGGGQTFLHLTYSYGYGIAGRVAMQAYLSTAGRDKVGFTVDGRQPDGQPDYVRGVRGMVERNSMRYFLAIDAYLSALAAPLQEQFEKRLQYWINAVERYPRQLHEMERAAYLEMKRSEQSQRQAAM